MPIATVTFDHATLKLNCDSVSGNIDDVQLRISSISSIRWSRELAHYPWVRVDFQWSRSTSQAKVTINDFNSVIIRRQPGFEANQILQKGEGMREVRQFVIQQLDVYHRQLAEETNDDQLARQFGHLSELVANWCHLDGNEPAAPG